MQRIDGDKTDDRSAIRIGDDTVMLRHVLGVDFGDDQRDIGVEAVRARVVHRDGSLFAGDGNESFGDVVFRRTEHDVNTVERFVSGLFDHHVFAFELHDLAGASGGGEQLEVVHGEILLGEALEHLLSHGARGAQNGNVIRLH